MSIVANRFKLNSSFKQVHALPKSFRLTTALHHKYNGPEKPMSYVITTIDIGQKHLVLNLVGQISMLVTKMSPTPFQCFSGFHWFLHGRGPMDPVLYTSSLQRLCFQRLLT